MPFYQGVGGGGAIRCIQDEGVLMPFEPCLNFTGGGVTLSDDPINGRTDVIVPLGAGGGWSDDGTTVRLTTTTDQVAVGDLTPVGTEKMRVVGQLRVDQGSLAAALISFTVTQIFVSSNNAGDTSGIVVQNTSDSSTAGSIIVAGTTLAQQSAFVTLAVGGTSASPNAGDILIVHYSGASTKSIRIQAIDTTSLVTTDLMRLYRSGAVAVGQGTNNDTSAEAQAGLTGPLVNVTATTGGALTSVANQTLLYNVAGQASLQGHAGISFYLNTSNNGAVDAFGVNGNPTGARATIGPRVGSAATIGAVYLGTVTPDASNFSLISNSSTLTIVNAPGAAGSVILAMANANYALVAWPGPVTIGQTTANDTQAEAACGLTGPMMNFSPTTGGTLTTAANQATLYNVAGKVRLQGNVAAGLEVGIHIMLVEGSDLGSAREVVSLCLGAPITTTEMPANTGDRVIFIANATTEPTASSVGGPLLWGGAGALKARGTGGTTATLCAAEPHCPVCGNDYIAEFKNEGRGHHVAICWTCFLDEAQAHGLDRKKFAFIDELEKVAA